MDTNTLSFLLCKKIETLFNVNYGADTNLRLLHFPKNLVPLPKWRGSHWEDSEVTGFVKCSDGCRKVTLRRNDDGLGGTLLMRKVISYDTIKTTRWYFQVNDKLLLTGKEVLVMTASGDTVSRWGSDLDVPSFWLRSGNNDYLVSVQNGRGFGAYGAIWG